MDVKLYSPSQSFSTPSLIPHGALISSRELLPSTGVTFRWVLFPEGAAPSFGFTVLFDPEVIAHIRDNCIPAPTGSIEKFVFLFNAAERAIRSGCRECGQPRTIPTPTAQPSTPVWANPPANIQTVQTAPIGENVKSRPMTRIPNISSEGDMGPLPGMLTSRPTEPTPNPDKPPPMGD